MEEAVHIREELNALLAKACMNLRKWRSNSTDLLQTIPDIIKEKEDVHMFSVPTDCHKALGIHWHTTKDTLHVATPIIEKRVYPTKRQISSDVAKTFDILGWFAPAIVIAKVLLQRLWQLNVGWDEKVPLDIATDWEKWRQQIHLLTGHPVPRCYYSVGKSRISIQLHGFADASQKAYAAVVYLRVLYSDTSISIALVTAKTKVAPISLQTIPRLELCAAVLLSKLLRSIMFDLQITMENVYAWSDSSIVLVWIRAAPQRLKTFVANRIINIVDRVPAKHWRHVATDQNPADPASRGLYPKDLLNNYLWWSGPPWLYQSPDTWPSRTDFLRLDLPEVRANVLHIQAEAVIDDIVLRYSSYQKLLRVVAWCLRFVLNIRKKQNRMLQSILLLQEVELAETRLIQLSQQRHYCKEIDILKKNRQLPLKSCLIDKHPFMDSQGILRVGGRLINSQLDPMAKHPAIIHGKDLLTELIIADLHETNQHTGPTSLIGLLSM